MWCFLSKENMPHTYGHKRFAREQKVPCTENLFLVFQIAAGGICAVAQTQSAHVPTKLS